MTYEEETILKFSNILSNRMSRGMVIGSLCNFRRQYTGVVSNLRLICSRTAQEMLVIAWSTNGVGVGP